MGAVHIVAPPGKEAARHPERDYRNQPLEGHLLCISLLLQLMHI